MQSSALVYTSCTPILVLLRRKTGAELVMIGQARLKVVLGYIYA